MTSSQGGDWKPHPDLEGEWKLFISECQRTAQSNHTSDLWMNYWRSQVPSSSNKDKTPTDSQESMDTAPGAEVDSMAFPAVHLEEKLNSSCVLAEDVVLTDSQLQQINSVALELSDILDMYCESIPEDLRECISTLPISGISVLLKELESRLTIQKTYNFCSLLCEEAAEGPCINVALVFEILFLPMLSGNSLENLSEVVKGGLIKLSEHFPSECVSHLLKPLITDEISCPSLRELLTALIEPLPENDFRSLTRYFVQHCSAPMEEWRILVIDCFLSKGRPSILEGKAESSPLIDLLPILTASSGKLSTSLLFASLLLKLIPVLKCSSSSKVHADLVTLVQENKSFNKQALRDALKCLET